MPSASAANAAAASFAALVAQLSYLSASDIDLVRKAYRFADEAHLGQLRKDGQPVRVEATNVEITLPNGYPRVPPIARTLAGDVVFHPNFSATKICLMDDWAPGVQLPDLIREIGEMLQWQKYNINSPLNASAAEWSQSHTHELPLSDHPIGGAMVKIVIN